MNNGTKCFRQSKRKAPIVECDKPARCARVLLERLPSKPDKYFEKEKIKLPQLSIFSKKSNVEEVSAEEITISEDNHPIGISANEPILKNSQKKVINFKHEEIKNSSDTGKSKRKKINLTDLASMDKINLTPIVLLEKLSIENLKYISSSNGEISELIKADNGLIQASSQNNEILKTEKEVKKFKKTHLESNSLNPGKEIQNKLLCSKVAALNVLNKSDSNEVISPEQKLISTDYKKSNISIVEKSCNLKRKNIKQRLKGKFCGKTIKGVNVYKKEKSSHCNTKEDSLTALQVPCKKNLRLKGKKIVKSKVLPDKQAILENSSCKDESVVNDKVKHKQTLVNSLLNNEISEKTLLEESINEQKETNDILVNIESSNKLIIPDEKCNDQNSLNNSDECIFQKAQSKSESKPKSIQLIKYPKIYIERISPKNLITNKKLIKNTNSPSEIKSNDETNNSEKIVTEISSQDDFAKQVACKNTQKLKLNSIEDIDTIAQNSTNESSVSGIENDEINSSVSESCPKNTNEEKDLQKSSVIQNFVQEDQKLFNNSNGPKKSALTKKSRGRIKFTELPHDSILPSEIELLNIDKIEKNSSDSDEILCKDNNNTQKFLNSSGDSNHTSNDENISSDSEKSILSNKIVSEKCSLSPDCTLFVGSQVAETKNLSFNQEVLSRNTESESNNENKIDHLPDDPVDHENSDADKPVNVNEFKIFSRCNEVKKLIENKKAAGEDFTNNEESESFLQNTEAKASKSSDDMENSVQKVSNDSSVKDDLDGLNSVEKIRSKLNTLICDEETSNDSVIEKESVETDEVLDEEFSNDSIENKKIYLESEAERKFLDERENSLAEPKKTLISTEKFEIHFEQEISNDSAMDDKLSESKKIALNEEIIVNTEIYLGQREEALSSDSGTEEKKSVNNYASFSDEESLSESHELSNNSDSKEKLSKLNENIKVCHELSNSETGEISQSNLDEKEQKSESSNFPVADSSTENVEVYVEQSNTEEPIECITQQVSEEIIHEQLAENNTLKIEENISDVIKEVVENIQNVVESEDKLLNEQGSVDCEVKKEILKDIVANEHSYYKDELETVANDTRSDDSCKRAKLKDNLTSHSFQNKLSDTIIINDCKMDSISKNIVIENCLTEIIEKSKKDSADMNVVEKIKNRLNNLKETCDLAFRNVTDIIRDCSSIIEKDLNELKKRHENENITNEKLLIINLDENKEIREPDSIRSENCIQRLKVGEKSKAEFNNDFNPEEFFLDFKFNHEDVNSYNVCVIDDHCPPNEVVVEEVKDDNKTANTNKDRSKSPCTVTEISNISEKISSKIFDNHLLVNNDHTYAESTYDKIVDAETSDKCVSNSIRLLERKFSRGETRKKSKTLKNYVPDPEAESEDEKMDEMNFESKSGCEKDATASLKEICKKIAARIHPSSSKDKIKNSSKSGSYSQEKITELLCISGSDDEEMVVKNNINDNQKQNSRRLSKIEKAAPELIQRAVSSERKKINSDDEFVEPIPFLDDGSLSGNNAYNVPMKCPKCDGIYFGYQRMKKHIVICGEEPNLSCPWCSRKLKYRQSLVKHFLKFHSNAVKPKDAQRIADELSNQVRKSSKHNKNIPALSNLGLSTLGHMPDFLKLYCNKCKVLLDWEPNHTRICSDCTVPMTINCQNCDRYDVLYNQVNFHVKGQCAPVRVTSNQKCSKCPFRTTQKYKLYDHMVTNHSLHVTSADSGEVCAKGCNRRFKLRSARLRHERHCGKEPDRLCKFCPFKSKHRSAIKVHIQQHVLNGETGASEMLCDDDDVDNLQNSIEAQTNGRNKTEYENRIRKRMSSSCVRCKKTVKITDTNNLCDCGRALIFTCNICNLKKSAYHPIRVHVIRRHLEKPFKCKVCWRHYSYFPDYKHHTAKCGQEPEKFCNFCSFRTFSLKSMESHKRKIHGAISKLPTCLKCGKTFTMARTLARHEERYCGVEAKLSCEHCSFMTKSKFSLKRHLQSIHYKIFTNVRFECENCMREFSSLYSGDTHAKTCKVVFSEDA